MTQATNPKIDLSEMTVPDARLEELLQLFPEAVTEGKIDFVRLRQALGDAVDPRKEKYGLSWAGKSEAIQVLQTSATGTLVPMPDESINFESSENLIIEGDNLEVLKLLQKSYYGKVKMIYIDPPYNTGNEFIYPDNFKEGLDDYLKYSGQTSEDGLKLSTNTEGNGRYHSKWLSMMYPRLFLAKNLLRQDGVIFVSIGAEEVHNLRCLLNEIFGEENFEGIINWRRRYNQPNDKTKLIATVTEYIICCSKSAHALKSAGVGKLGLTGKFTNPDNDPRGEWASKPWKVGSGQSGSAYKVTSPTGKVFQEEWMGDEANYNQLFADKRIYFTDNGNGLPRKKYYKFERLEEGQCATNWWPHDIFGHNQEASSELAEIFGAKNVFSNPKPHKLIKNLVQLGNCKDNDIVLDFFSGSGTTAHSVIAWNQESGENIRYIVVQLPEVLESSNPEHEVPMSLGFKTIFEICKARIVKVLQNSDSASKGYGFKAFKLSSSNFKEWRQEDNNTGDEAFAQQLRLHIENVKEQRNPLDIVYEIALKLGYELSVAIEQITLAKQPVYSIAGGEFLLCVEKKITPETLREMMKRKPKRIMCLDVAFEGNDTLKTNIVLEMQSHSIAFHTV